jgi:hypothetical protein
MEKAYVIFLVIIGTVTLSELATAHLSASERDAIRWAMLIPIAYLLIWWVRRRRWR